MDQLDKRSKMEAGCKYTTGNVNRMSLREIKPDETNKEKMFNLKRYKEAINKYATTVPRTLREFLKLKLGDYINWLIESGKVVKGEKNGDTAQLLK
ncbi:MAG: hypothetical protein DSO07_00810 [Thermoproteota archaeon]|uniref:AbrB/MazE/SpoVT family DNA-binding domain-containing protein n=1 Tax=Candidatus Methanodesulfokora washburnensis TaxID=2478471 RepID=A0A429GY36_9CREN|nr:hypothetical protein D6D85_00655 [Candidatus Methanodesulfokores washburnensis]TDA42158.1 MAG: hypothetical protein DSO07_00810 [Candidatus Korarchaeota archaeon]